MPQALTRRVELTDSNSKVTITQTTGLINQRSAFAVQAVLGAKKAFKTVTKKNLFTARTQHTLVNLVLRTPTLYADGDVIAVVVWTDGPGFGGIVGQSVNLVLTTDTGKKHTLTCGTVLSSARDCSQSLNKPSWFQTDRDVLVSVQAVTPGTGFKSTSQKVTLVKKQPPAGIKSAGIYITLPSYPVVTSSSFDVHVFASTDAVKIAPRKKFALQVLTFEITHSPVFQFSSIVSPSSLYDLTENHEGGAKVRVVAVQGSGITDSAVTGTQILVARLRMTVGDLSRDNRAPFRVKIVDMVSSASLKVLANVPGSVYPSGSVKTSTPTTVGLLAQAASWAEQELINFASLGLASPTSKIAVRVVRSCHISTGKRCHESATQSITTGFECVPTNAKVLNGVGKNECSVFFTGLETQGGDAAVQVTYKEKSSTLSAQVRFRAWFPKKFELHVADPILNRVVMQSGRVVRNDADCRSDLFQSTAITASAVLSRVTDNGPVSSSRLDITDKFKFVATGGIRDAVSITGNIVQGMKPASGLKIGCQRGCRGKTVELSVTSKSTPIKRLSASILNRVTITPKFDGGKQFSHTDSFAVTAVASNSMTREGDAAQVFVNMKTGDDAFVSVPSNQLNVTSSVLTVSQDTVLTVPIGAAKAEGCDLVFVSWWSCGVSVASVRPFVSLELPAVVSIALTAYPTTIFSRADPLAYAPVYAPTSTRLTVIVSFEDKQKRDFSTDSRASFVVDQRTLAEVYQTNDGRRHLRVPGNHLGHGKVLVTVELGKYAPGIKGSTTVTVDKFKSLELSSRSFPHCADKGCSAKTIINRLPKGTDPTRGAFQRISLSLAAYSEYGSRFNVGPGTWTVCKISDRGKLNLPDDARVCPSNSGGACVIAKGELRNHAPLSGVSAGDVSVSATWREKIATLDLKVTDTIVRVTRLQQAQKQRSTVSGVINSKHTVGVKSTFSDETSFYQKQVASWVPVSTYLVFKSDDQTSLTTSEDGIMTLTANSPGPGTFNVRVSAKADTHVHSTVPIYTNLRPGPWDLDVEVGRDRGAQFSYKTGDKTLTVSVRLQTGNDAVLTNFQFSLSFDSSVLQIQQGDALAGKDWPYAFSATTGDPINEVLVRNIKG